MTVNVDTLHEAIESIVIVGYLLHSPAHAIRYSSCTCILYALGRSSIYAQCTLQTVHSIIVLNTYNQHSSHEQTST